MTHKNLTKEQIDVIVNHYKFNSLDEMRFKRYMNQYEQAAYKPYMSGGRKYARLVAEQLLKAPNFHLSRLDLLNEIKDKIIGRTPRWDGAVDMFFKDLEEQKLVNRSSYANPNEAWIELNDLGKVYFGLILEDLSPKSLIEELNEVLNPSVTNEETEMNMQNVFEYLKSTEDKNKELTNKNVKLTNEKKELENKANNLNVLNEKLVLVNEDLEHDKDSLEGEVKELKIANEKLRAKLAWVIDNKIDKILEI